MKLALAATVFALFTAAAANAATIEASSAIVPVGTSTIELTLDPEGVTTGAWLVVLDAVGLTIDSITGVVPSGTDCFGLSSASSFDGQCASAPLVGSAVVASVTITAAMPGGTLSLASGNITDFGTFLDTAFTPGVLMSVPEPAVGALLVLGLLPVARRLRD